jgi:hypothetical protein
MPFSRNKQPAALGAAVKIPAAPALPIDHQPALIHCQSNQTTLNVTHAASQARSLRPMSLL